MSMFPIATTGTLTGATTGIAFTSIPSGFTHLQIRAFTRATNASVANGFIIRFNSDSSNLYASHVLKSNGTTATSGSDLSIPWNSMGWSMAPGNSATSGVFGTAVIDVLDYSNTNKNKTVRVIAGFDNNGSGQVGNGSGLYVSTSAINHIAMYPLTSNDFAQYSRFDLYGISISNATGA